VAIEAIRSRAESPSEARTATEPEIFQTTTLRATSTAAVATDAVVIQRVADTVARVPVDGSVERDIRFK